MSDSKTPDETLKEDDPFKEFEDWLVDGPAGKWPAPLDNKALSQKQKEIVGRNATCLTDPDAGVWKNKVQRFEFALTALGDALKVAAKRAEYAIHFDYQSFVNGPTDFSGFHFPCSLSFANAQFGMGDVVFDGATFANGEVCFDFATFVDGALTFEGMTTGACRFTFDQTEFGQCWISFRDAKMRKSTLLMRSQHLRDVFIFESVDILGADFAYTQIDGLAGWAFAKFGTIPDFRHTVLNRAPEVARMEVPSPEMTVVLTEKQREQRQLPRRYFVLPVAASDDDVFRLRKLKAMAIAANDHEKDGEFFAYEMMAKRGVEHTTFWQLLANAIYWKVSDYGQSYLLPLGWLFFTGIGFAILYALMATPPMEGISPFWFGLAFSFLSSVPLLGSIVGSVPVPPPDPDRPFASWFGERVAEVSQGPIPYEWFTVLGAFQSFLGAFFFFFLLLGLRNRFRLK